MAAILPVRTLRNDKLKRAEEAENRRLVDSFPIE